MKYLLIFALIVSNYSCLWYKSKNNNRSTLFKDKKQTSYIDTSLITVYNTKFPIRKVCEMWKSDTFGCRKLRFLIDRKDSIFRQFVFSLSKKELIYYFGKPNYIQKGAGGETSFIYILVGDPYWCKQNEFRKISKMKYIMEKLSYEGVEFYFDKYDKVSSFVEITAG